MREGWEEKKIGEISETIMGQAPPGKDCNRENVGYPFVKTGQFGEKYPKINEWTTNPLKKVTEGDVLITVVGATIGKLNLGAKCAIGRSVAGIRPADKILNQMYLYNYLSLWVERLREMSTGAAITVISKKMIYDIPIPIPSLSEQKRIVAILNQAFEAIDQAKANIEKNLVNAKELFQSKLNAIFSQKGDDWEQKSLGDEALIEMIDGDRGKNYPKKSDFLEEGHCIFMNTGNVRPDGFDFSKVVFITEERDNLLSKGKLQREDVVMTTRGTIGNLGWYNSDIEYENIRINSGMLIFRVNQEKILPEYLFSIFRSSIVKKQILENKEVFSVIRHRIEDAT